MYSKLLDSIRAVKRRILVLLGKDLVLRPEVRVDTEFHGTIYGGFSILKNSLDSSSIVLSFGIGEDASFDLSLIEKYQCVIQAFDPTPKSVDWVNVHIHDIKFIFHKCAISDVDGKLRLFLPKRKDFVSASFRPGKHTSADYIDVCSKRLSTIVRELKLDKIAVLKMDVEGAEYLVLKDYFSNPHNPLPSQLALEFHHFYPEFGVRATHEAIHLLKQRGYRLGWVSPLHRELLFLRDDRKA